MKTALVVGAFVALHLASTLSIYEDGSFRMGLISGCMPASPCATDWTDECPAFLEDVACWEGR